MQLVTINNLREHLKQQLPEVIQQVSISNEHTLTVTRYLLGNQKTDLVEEPVKTFSILKVKYDDIGTGYFSMVQNPDGTIWYKLQELNGLFAEYLITQAKVIDTIALE